MRPVRPTARGCEVRERGLRDRFVSPRLGRLRPRSRERMRGESREHHLLRLMRGRVQRRSDVYADGMLELLRTAGDDVREQLREPRDQHYELRRLRGVGLFVPGNSYRRDPDVRRRNMHRLVPAGAERLQRALCQYEQRRLQLRGLHEAMRCGRERGCQLRLEQLHIDVRRGVYELFGFVRRRHARCLELRRLRDALRRCV